jgi:HK97 family phage major capsid protein
MLDDMKTNADLKAVLKEYLEQIAVEGKAKDEKHKAEMDAVNLTVAKILEASVKQTATSVSADKNICANEVFKAARHGDMERLCKHGGRAIAKGDDTWKGEEWLMDAAQKAALGSYYLRGDATTGSYLVPVEYASDILRVAGQASIMYPRITRIPMSARTLYYPAESTMLSVYWVTDETTAKTEAQYVLAQRTLSAKTAAAYFGVTDELLEDSLVALPQYFNMLFSEAWGKEIDKQTLVASTAPFVGMTVNTSCNAVNMGPGKTSFANVTFEDLVAMENAISVAVGENGLAGAYFIMHRKVFNYLKVKKDDDGQPIYMKPADGVPATIYGYPYIISDQMPSTDAVSTGFIVLGNPKYWIMGERVAVDFRIFDQTSYTLLQDQVFFRFRVRAAFVGGVPAAFAVLKTAAA